MRQIIQLASAAVESPGAPILDQSDPAIRTDAVYVVHTSIDDTLAAVRLACGFAKGLDVPVTLVHFRAVPYALPLDAPCGISPVETDEFLERLRAEGLDISVRVDLCRDECDAIPLAFKPHSLIVIAGQRRWWPTRTDRWRRALEAAGHFVMVVDHAEHKERSNA